MRGDEESAISAIAAPQGDTSPARGMEWGRVGGLAAGTERQSPPSAPTVTSSPGACVTELAGANVMGSEDTLEAAVMDICFW